VFQRPVLLGLVALCAVLAGGTLGYMAIEGWSALDALWMVMITLTTIGFGEVHPLSPNGRLFTLGLIVAGLGIGTYTMTQITAQVVEGRFGAALATRRRRRQLETLNDHFIVVGYGRLGQTIVEELRASGVRVCVIEKDPKAIADLHALGLPLVDGDGSTDDVLRLAGIGRARGVAVAVSSSAEAVFVTLSARELNPTVNIVTRVADAEHAVKARRAGASSVVSPHTMGGWRMAHGLVRPHASSFLDLATLATHAEIQLDEFVVHPASALVGNTLKRQRVAERFGVLVVAIRRADGKMVATPDASTELAAHDVLIVIGAPEKVQRFGAELSRDRTAS
jgi:voltage-gated potassium channel